MDAHLKRKIRKIIAPFRRIGLKCFDFSIISNNCWGGYVYDIFGLQYLTPTIGLYFIADDYVKFIGNLKYYLSFDIVPISKEESKWNGKAQITDMIGKLGDIEVMFAHYDSLEDACKKWNYRRMRVNWDKILVKFNDQNNFTLETLDSFNSSNFKNKLFFTAKKEYCFNSYSYWLNEYKNENYVLDDIKSSSKYLNIKKFLNEIK